MGAPLAPLITEEVWRGLTGGESVHLTDWPDATDFPSDLELVEQMDTVRAVASAGLGLRKANQLRVRLPLAELTVVVDAPDRLKSYREILAEELNVKLVTLVQRTEQAVSDFGVEQRLVVNARALGPRLGKQVQSVIAAAKDGTWEIGPDGPVVAGHTLDEGEYELTYDVSNASSAVAFVGTEGFVILHTEVTEELEREGLARDIIRIVQQARKDQGLDVSDRISLVLSGDLAVSQAVNQHRDLIATETLAVSLELGSLEGQSHAVGLGCEVTVSLEKV
jgi:isoleucyl-tRNA synthetase